MSMIPDEKVREVRARATILDVVSDYVNLKKSGSNFLGLCPLHGEKTLRSVLILQRKYFIVSVVAQVAMFSALL